MDLPRVNSIASVGIIFRRTNPLQIFLERKDEGYPVKAVCGLLSLIGGNWIGDDARGDKNTLDTFLREAREELSLDTSTPDMLELSLLGFDVSNMPGTKRRITRDRAPTIEEKQQLQEIISEIDNSTVPYRDFLLTIPKSVYDRVDPENTQPTTSAICSYWCSPLPEHAWKALATLQAAFGNISSESFSLVTSLENIVKREDHIAFGHDRVIKKFFEDLGFANSVRNLSLVEGITVEEIGLPLASYGRYLEKYSVAKHP